MVPAEQRGHGCNALRLFFIRSKTRLRLGKTRLRLVGDDVEVIARVYRGLRARSAGPARPVGGGFLATCNRLSTPVSSSTRSRETTLSLEIREAGDQRPRYDRRWRLHDGKMSVTSNRWEGAVVPEFPTRGWFPAIKCSKSVTSTVPPDGGTRRSRPTTPTGGRRSDRSWGG